MASGPRRVTISLIGAAMVATKPGAGACALMSEGGSGAIKAAIMPGAISAAIAEIGGAPPEGVGEIEGAGAGGQIAESASRFPPRSTSAPAVRPAPAVMRQPSITTSCVAPANPSAE